MNRITRLLAIAGMSAGAALALAGPAQAASADAAHQAPTGTQAHWGNGDRIVGFFDNPFTCNRVGRIGEIRNRWDDYDCYRVRFGFHRGDWALSISQDDWNGPWDNNGPWDHSGPWGHGGPIGGPWHHGGPIGGPFGHDNNDDHDGPMGGHGPFHPAGR